MIVCVAGTFDQWIGQYKRILKEGDSAYFDANIVHATVNEPDESSYALAGLGPCVGELGYELVDVGDDLPWNDLRLK